MILVNSLRQPCAMARWDETLAAVGLRFHGHEAARAFLQVYKSSPVAMTGLREALQLYGDDVLRAGDDQVIDELAALIVSSRILVLAQGEALPPQGGQQPAPPPPPQPPAPRPPAPRPPAPRPPPPPPEPPPPPVPPVPVDPKGDLVVEIVDDQGQPITEEVEISASGPASLSQKTQAGTHTFKQVALGVYSVTVKTAPKHFDKDSDTRSSSAVPAGGQGKTKHSFTWLANVVTPKLELEYKVVLLDRKLSAHQPEGEARLQADVTRVEVSAKESTGAPKYTGDGSFEVAPANVEVYTDPACTTKLAGKLPNAQLFGGSPVAIYLKGVKAGLFKAKLTLDPANDGRITVQPPAEEEMGVVELKLTLHEHDVPALEGKQVDPDTEPPSKYHDDLKAFVLPDQKAMTDAAKIKDGRLLHLQADNHHGRAKLVVEKLDVAQWPGGTDDYDIVLAQAGAQLALHGKEDEADAKPMPHAMKVSALKGAAQTLWVEGAAASLALRDGQVDLGLDRADGGLAKTPKRNGDAARFTVVKIEEVKVEYKKADDEFDAWDEAEKRWFVNVNRKGTPEGRKVKLRARLSIKLAGVPLRLMLAPDKDNAKAANWGIDFPTDGKHKGTVVHWKDVPVAMKHVDRKQRKDLLHLGKKTDADGMVEIELQWSLFGGDKFHPAAYLAQDPHLAKYVHGHDDLGKRKPVFAALTPVQVWRKSFYQVSRPKDTAMPAPGGFQDSQRKVFLETEVLSENLMTAANFTVDPYRPDWQFNPGGSDDLKLCIGTHNVDAATKLFVKETKATAPKFHVIICDEQFDAKNVRTDVMNVLFDNANQVARDVQMTIAGKAARKVSLLSPPLQGGKLIISGTWQQLKKTGGNWVNDGGARTLAAGNVEVQKTRARKDVVNVAPPAGGVIDATHAVKVTLRLQAADGGYNGWAPNDSVANVVKGGRADFEIHNTMAHELGHLFGKVRHDSRAGIPDHPLYYQKRGGSGTHCAFNATWTDDPTAPALDPTKANELDAQGHGAGQYDDGECIIFGYSVPNKREWCKHCALDFILSDLSKFG